LKPILLMALCIGTASAADRDFNDVVRAIGDQLHAQPRGVPLFGLVNLFAARTHPAGASHIDLAIFENVGSMRGIPDSVRAAIGGSWKPFVQVRSRRDDDTVLVYMRELEHDWKLLIVNTEPRQATVIQIRLNPEEVARWVNDPEHRARHWN
jgi:hypothetical protein